MSNSGRAVACRCEDITIDTIRECIKNGCRTINEIKHETRAGMGPCQGRTCRMIIAQEISRYYNIPLEEVLLPAFRVPVEPISIAAMADACRRDRENELS